MSKKSEWEIAVENFNEQKLKEPVFINTLLTVDDCDVLLGGGDYNRALNVRLVDKYLIIMNNKEWVLNGDCIKISKAGLLLDGQHRLNALKKHNKPVRMSVVIGLDQKLFSIIDTGKPRSAGDVLNIAGYKNYYNLAAVLRLLLIYKMKENFTRNISLEAATILAAAKRYPHINSFLGESARLGFLCTTSSLHFLMYVTHTIDPEKALLFFNKLATGEKLGKTSPILQLRETLLKYRAHSLALDKRHLMATLILAWNAFYSGQRIKTVKWSPADGFPIISGLNRKKLFSVNSGFNS